MNENKTKIAGILYKHGENDFSIWFPELTESENKEINALPILKKSTVFSKIL